MCLYIQVHYLLISDDCLAVEVMGFFCSPPVLYNGYQFYTYLFLAA